MGTLFNQTPRCRHDSKEDMERFLLDLEMIQKAGYSENESIDIMMAFQLKRRNDIKVNDNDSKDEQLAGFGEILKTLIENLGKKDTD